jgi:hypothetical protein
MTRAGETLDQIWATVEPLIECGEKEPASEPTARRVRGRWLAALSTWADAIPDPQRARTWANEGCQLGDEIACERVDVFQSRETVAIPVRPWLSYPLLGTPSLELVLGTRSMRLEGRPVSDGQDLIRSLRHRLGDRPLLGRDVAVHVDASVPYAKLRAVSDVLWGHGLVPRVVVRDPAGRLMALEVRPPAADSTNIELVKVSWRAKTLVRTPGAALELVDVPSGATWGQVSERLLELGAPSASPSEAEAARNRAVGSSSAVPPLILAD